MLAIQLIAGITAMVEPVATQRRTNAFAVVTVEFVVRTAGTQRGWPPIEMGEHNAEAGSAQQQKMRKCQK